jgi:DNA-binding beta-propeller fold protein YncE
MHPATACRLATLALFLASPAAARDPIIQTIAGTGERGYDGDDGPAIKAVLDSPFHVALDAAGNVYFSDTANHCVRRIAKKTGTIVTVVGTGEKGYTGDGGPATKATLNEPYGIAIDADGRLYIADRLNAAVRRVGKDGNIDTIAGTGTVGFSGDGGLGNKAELREPNGLALDPRFGKLYIADVADQRVRVLDLATLKIDTFCGDGERRQAGDGGPFKEASLFGPRAVAVGPNGNLYVCEREGNAIRMIDFKSGKIARIAGTGERGYAGDNGPALRATFNGPKDLFIDRAGNLFVVDTENHAVRRIDARTSTVTTIAGTGEAGGTGDGEVAVKATLARPHGVAVAPDGTVIIGDTLNNRIRVVK